MACKQLLPTPLGYTAASTERRMPDSLKDVLDTTVKMVNFVKARPLNSRVFSALCNDMSSDHVTFLQHMLVIKGQSIDTFFKNGETSLKFFTDHNFNLSDRLQSFS